MDRGKVIFMIDENDDDNVHGECCLLITDGGD